MEGGEWDAHQEASHWIQEARQVSFGQEKKKKNVVASLFVVEPL